MSECNTGSSERKHLSDKWDETLYEITLNIIHTFAPGNKFEAPVHESVMT